MILDAGDSWIIGKIIAARASVKVESEKKTIATATMISEKLLHAMIGKDESAGRLETGDSKNVSNLLSILQGGPDNKSLEQSAEESPER